MNVVGFNKLNKRKSKKRCFVFCIQNVFRNCMIVGGVLLFMLVLNLISKTFLKDAVVSVEQFVKSFVRLR